MAPKIVLVEKLDRLARDLMVQETIIGDLRKNGFELISVMEPDLGVCNLDLVIGRNTDSKGLESERLLRRIGVLQAEKRPSLPPCSLKFVKPKGPRLGRRRLIDSVRNTE